MKKFWIALLIVIIVFVGFGAFCVIKGNVVFGRDYCDTDHFLEFGGDAFTDWECAICGKNGTNPDTNVPKLCTKCYLLTNRCHECGKLNK